MTTSSPHITLNGAPCPVAGHPDIRTLLVSLNLNPARVVVEHNGAILPPEHLDTTPLAAGDTVEIVHFVGGG